MPVRTAACSLSSDFNSREISRALLKLPRASKRESCSISPSCSVDIGRIPVDLPICLWPTATYLVKVWQRCGLPAPCPPRLRGPRARDDLRRHDKKPPLQP